MGRIISTSINKTKTMLKPQTKTSSMFHGRLKKPLLILSALILVSGVGVPLVRAATCSSTSDCQSQINDLNNKNAVNKQALGSLQSQATSYQDAINQLQGQISSLQQQITANQAQQASLQQQITDDENKIAYERQVLGEDIKTMYVDGQMSTIEELATSNNLSEYVDKEEYRTAVQNKIQSTLQEIKTLQAQLEKQKADLDVLVANEQQQKSQLASEQAQQQQLFNMNQAQQASYNAQISANKSSISALQARLAALNTTSDSRVLTSGTCGGGYPNKASGPHGNWGCSYAQDNTVDNWNMYNRECVSYTAWMVYSKYGKSTFGWGSAYQWINSAESHGYLVDQNPTPGSIAIRDRNYSEPGDVGHAMYVASVKSSSDITVWEYNEHFNGTFDEREFNPYNYSTAVYYIHFQ